MQQQQEHKASSVIARILVGGLILFVLGIVISLPGELIQSSFLQSFGGMVSMLGFFAITFGIVRFFIAKKLKM